MCCLEKFFSCLRSSRGNEEVPFNDSAKLRNGGTMDESKQPLFHHKDEKDTDLKKELSHSPVALEAKPKLKPKLKPEKDQGDRSASSSSVKEGKESRRLSETELGKIIKLIDEQMTRLDKEYHNFFKRISINENLNRTKHENLSLLKQKLIEHKGHSVKVLKEIIQEFLRKDGMTKGINSKVGLMGSNILKYISDIEKAPNVTPSLYSI